MQQLQRSKADCWQLRRSSVMQASHDAVCGLCFRTQACAQLPQRHDGAVQSLQYADLPHAEVLLGILREAGLWHFVACLPHENPPKETSQQHEAHRR